jgi:hypothetical protein
MFFCNNFQTDRPINKCQYTYFVELSIMHHLTQNSGE